MNSHRVLVAAFVGALTLASTVSASDAMAPRLGATSTHILHGTLRGLGASVGLHVGTALMASDVDQSAYGQLAADQFSTITPEYEMKWQAVEPTQGTYDWSAADRIVRFAEQYHQRVRGHTLLWHDRIPQWLTAGVSDGSITDIELRTLVRKHITDEVTHFKGKIWQWDVANEFFIGGNPARMNPNDFWVAHLGPGIVADAFRWAHAADPHALLFYNDYNIVGEDGSNAKSDAVFAWLKQMIAAHVPIDGVGDQAHLDVEHPFPSRMGADLQRYTSLGLKVAITEADVRTAVNNPTEQIPIDPRAAAAQADDFSKLLMACLAVRNCISFTVWGFGDAHSWIPGFFPGDGYATLYDVDLRPKPAYVALRRDLARAGGRHADPASPPSACDVMVPGQAR